MSGDACEHGWTRINHVRCPRCGDAERHAAEIAALRKRVEEAERQRDGCRSDASRMGELWERAVKDWKAAMAERDAERAAHKATREEVERLEKSWWRRGEELHIEIARALAAEAQLAAAVEVVRQVEWSGIEHGKRWCPICSGTPGTAQCDGHAPDCALAAVLGARKEESR